MRRWNEMNLMEQKGARQILKSEGWSYGSLFSAYRPNSKSGWTKGLVSVHEDDIMIGEDAWEDKSF